MENKKKIRKIYYWKYSDKLHIAIKELIEHPPEGYKFVIASNKNISVDNISNFKNNKIISRLHDLFLKKIITPRRIMRAIFTLKKIPDCDLIYSFGDPVTKKKNWVVEIDSVWDLTENYKYEIDRKKLEKILSSKYCKKIMPWNSYSKRIMEEQIDTSNFKDKIEVVHTAASIPNLNIKRKKDDKVRILFVGTSNQVNDLAVFSKGIREAVKAFNILNKKYKNIKLIIVSQIPECLKEEVKGNKNIEVIGIVPREEIFRIYKKSDFFIYPAYFTQSLSMIEAIGSGLPVITTDMYTDDFDSMVEDGKNGFLVRIPNKESYILPIISDFGGYMQNFYKNNKEIMIKGIVEKASKLIENKKLRGCMGKKSREKYLKEYSIEARNKKLKKIFDEIKD